MGSSASTYKTTARPELKSIFDTMHLSKQEISKLYEIFKSIDKEKTGRIRARELLNFLDIDTSLFAERIFSPFEKNSTEDNQSIDFFGFVLSLWRFCSLGKESVAEFVFDLYDTDNDGVLTEEEAKVMFNDLHFYGREIVEDEESKTLRVELLETKNGEITPAHFHVFFTDHKMLVLPLFLVQKRLRDAFLGQKFWKDMSERSVILSPKRKVSLADIMVAEEDRVIFHQLLHDNSANSLRQLMKQAVETELLTATKPIDIHNNYGTTTGATTSGTINTGSSGTSSSNMILEESNSLKQMKKELLQHDSIKDAGRVG